MSWTVPLADVKLSEDDVQAVLECLGEGWLTMGPRIRQFEEAVGEYVGAPFAAAVSSGTAALHLAMVAAGVGPGDEVIVPALPFVATAASVRYAGGTPVLCDVIGADDFSIDVERVQSLVTDRTKGVAVVHVMGYPAPVDGLLQLCEEHGLFLIEDAAQAIGATVDGRRQAGTVGTAGVYSFFSKGQLFVGEGGMVVTSDEAVDARVRSLRSHAMTSVTWDRHLGHWDSYDIVDVGFNFRLDEPRAALGLRRLAQLDADIAARRRIVQAYREGLADVDGVQVAFSAEAVAHSSPFAFPILLEDGELRNAFRRVLGDRGVQTTWYPSTAQLTAYVDAAGAEDVPRANDVAARHCCLPLSPSLSSEQVEYVLEAVRGTLSALDGSRAASHKV